MFSHQMISIELKKIIVIPATEQTAQTRMAALLYSIAPGRTVKQKPALALLTFFKLAQVSLTAIH